MVLVSFDEDDGSLRKEGYVCVTEKIADDNYTIEYRGRFGTTTRYPIVQLELIDSLTPLVVWRCSR